VKNPFRFLELILTRWEWASRQPKICLLGMMKPHRVFPKFEADLIQAMFSSGGNYQAAADYALKKNPDCAARVDNFLQWAKRLVSPARRGLLIEWKGGAS